MIQRRLCLGWGSRRGVHGGLCALSCWLLACLVLAACGGGGNGSSSQTPEPPGESEEPPPESDGAPPDSDGEISRPDVAIERAYPGLTFNQPIAMLQAPGAPGSWFLLERGGRLWRFGNQDDVTTRSLVADLSGRVSTDGEGGALGIAFHPQFATNGRVFVSYTAPGSPLESRLSEFISSDGGESLNAAGERFLLTVPQDYSNHNGGHIAFGPDGFLYFGLGDGGSANDPLGRAQDTTNLLGAMLRIDVDTGDPYGIPGTNPFAGNPLCVQGFGGGNCPELYAWGLRNPWRWSFDSGSGALWLADVGQNAWEEINLIERGGNYGWPVREGAHCNPNLGSDSCSSEGFIDPVAEYGHELGSSVTGGYVYRGSRIPALSGSYVFADFVSGRIWRLEQAGAGFNLDELLRVSSGIVSFAQDAEGELYLLNLSGGGIHRLIEAD
jgi:glucose/arabinose dehydrogenase